MKYSDILGLYEHFQPVYDITNELKEYWKRFIPNERFYDILQTTLNAFESGQIKDRKPIWMHGTYGTGKTHAMAVIKHLLWDDNEETEEYVEGCLNHAQIRERLKAFRSNKRVFPVVLKGISNIMDNRTFALTIERAVKNALQQHNIHISTQSDFEKMVVKIAEGVVNWDKIIEENPELLAYLKDKQDLLQKLQADEPDIEIFRMVETSLSRIGIHLSHESISTWLSQVSAELQRQGVADALMLFWDEFTNLLELGVAKELLTELQHVAELSVSDNVSLFVISHRRLAQSSLTQDELNKILGRFHDKNYSMEPVTTYHIVSNAIKKKDTETWETLKKQYLDNNQKFNPLIQRLLKGNESASAMKEIRRLFPIHPYTAYLATFIAQYLGSTERSIFNFLYDENKGFLPFINNHPQNDNDHYLTADYLWDYFAEDFEKTEKFSFGAILEKYRLHKPDLDKRGTHYLSVFKGILLLNALSQVTGGEGSGKELVSPSVDNITSMFVGTQYEEPLPEILNVIDMTYIQKTPDHLFLISTTALPLKEIEEQKKQFESTYDNVTNVLNHEQKQDLLNTFQNGTLRAIEVVMFQAGMQEHILRSRLNTVFKHSYSLHTVLFLMKEEIERPLIRTTIEKLSSEENFQNLIFVIADEALGNERFTKFLEYRARAEVAEKHLFDEEKVTNEEYARKIIEKWVADIRNSFIEIRFRAKTKKNITSVFPATVNKELSPAIFRYGLETIKELRENQNIWNRKSEKAIEAFLFSDSRSALEEKTNKHPYKSLRGIVKDKHGESYIIHKTLEIKSEASDLHPVKRMVKEVKEAIKTSEQFHLGNLLRFLTEPPYGLYSNSVNMAAMGFVMGRYVGKLYEAGTGRLVSRQMMRDKIQSLFKYWQEGKDGEKLQLRYGTIEEKKLTEKLQFLFNFGDIDGLTNVRWGVRDWIKKTDYPLWVLKQEAVESLKKAIDEIVWLTTSIDKEITQQDIKRILHSITANELDLQLLLQKDSKQAFIAWLISLDLIPAWEAMTVSEVYTYLTMNMQEEIPSWTENKTRETVKKWKKDKKQQELEAKIQQENQLIVALQNIFALDNVENLRNVRWKIREWIETSRYPLWVFKPLAGEPARDIIDEIAQMARFIDREVSPEDVERLSNFVVTHYVSLKTILKQDKARYSFVVWLNRIDNLEVSEDTVDELTTYLSDKIQKEPVLWEEGEVREKIREWQLKKVEEEKQQKIQRENVLIGMLADIFGFAGANSLNDIRLKIRTWTEDVYAPLWVFKTSASDDVKAAIDGIVSLTITINKDITLQEINQVLNAVTDREEELKRVFQQDAQQKFIDWLNSIEQVDITEVNLTDLLHYLANNMSQKVIVWREEQVRETVKDWQNKELKRKLAEAKRQQEDIQKPPVVKDPTDKEKIKRVKQRVILYEGDMKPLVLKLIERHPDICDDVFSYLRDET